VRWTGEGEARDLSQDAEFCDAIVMTDPRAQAKPALHLFGVLGCLEQMGWESTVPPAQRRVRPAQRPAKPRRPREARAPEEPPPPREERATEQAPPRSPLEDHVVFVGDGPRPDLKMQQELCRRRVEEDPRARDQPGLAFLGQLACLGELGWEPDGDAWERED
jgi:hypothetical protein